MYPSPMREAGLDHPRFFLQWGGFAGLELGIGTLHGTCKFRKVCLSLRLIIVARLKKQVIIIKQIAA